MNDYLFVLYIFGSLLLTLFAITLTIILIIQRQRQVKSKLEKQNLQFQHETELLNARLDVQEQSMSLISEELHDNIGQVLGLAKMYIGSLKTKLKESDDNTVQLVDKTHGLVTKVISDLRHISHSLNSNLIQQLGLVQLIERDLDHLTDSSGLKCNLHASGTPYPFSPEQDLLIYRIVQEALQNVLKHANANNIDLCLSYNDNGLTIVIRDDGKGFDTAEAGKSQSLGLRNIKNRASLLRAPLEIISTPGNGTTVNIQIPLNKNGD